MGIKKGIFGDKSSSGKIQQTKKNTINNIQQINASQGITNNSYITNSTETTTLQKAFSRVRGSGNVVPNNVRQTYTAILSTIPSINKFAVYSVKTNSVILTWYGEYSNTTISYDTNLTKLINAVSKNILEPQHTTTISNLSANTKYTFSNTPYFNTGVYGTTQTISTTTYGDITSFELDIIDTSSVSFSYDGTYTNVIIKYGTTSGSNNYSYNNNYLTENYGEITDLSLNTTYYFSIYPINSEFIEGDKYVTDLSTTTIGVITSFNLNIIDSSSVSFIYDGIYTNVIIKYGTTPGSTTYSKTITGSETVNGIISDLSDLTIYYFNIYPINSDLVEGEKYAKELTGYELPAIDTFISSTKDASSVSLSWSGQYTSAVINYGINLSKTITASSPNFLTEHTTIITSLNSNTEYTFTIIPYLSVNGTDTSGTTQTVTTTTYSKLTELYTASYYDTSAVVAFDGSFDSVDISTNGLNMTYTTERDTGLDISGLTPGTTYNVTTNVKNSDGFSISGDSISFTTLSKIKDFSATAIDSSSISVGWTTIGDISSVSLIWNTSGGTYDAATDSSGIYTSSPAYITDLSLANTRYYFQIKPISSAGTGYAVNDASSVTYGKLTTLTAASWYDTSAVVAFDGSFDSVDISTNGLNMTYTTERDTGLDISGLIPGTTYNVTTSIRNTAGFSVSGDSIYFTTLSKIKDFSATAIDSSSIYVEWTTIGDISSVSLIWNTTGGTYDAATESSGIYTSSPAYITGLSLANTQYYFQITPISAVGSGYSVNDASSVTYGKLTELYTASYYDTSAVVAFDGSFDSVDISTNGLTTTYTTERDTGLDISGLIPGTTYNVTTSIKNSAGFSVSGDSIYFTTLSKIKDFSATAIDSSSISVEWTTIGDISSVSLIWNTTGDAYDAATDSSGVYTSSPVYITGLSLENTQYYFQITPINLEGKSANSSFASATTSATVSIDPNLLLYLPLNNDTLNYASGSGVSIGGTNTATFSTFNNGGSKSSGSLYCDGTTKFSSTMSSALATNGSPFTISYWLYMNDSGQHGTFRLSPAVPTTNDSPGLSNKYLGIANQKFQVYGGIGYAGWEFNYTYVDNTWIHICEIYNNTSFVVYINNTLAVNTYMLGNVLSMMYDVNYIELGETRGTYTRGYMSNFRLYNKVLSVEERSIIYTQKI